VRKLCDDENGRPWSRGVVRVLNMGEFPGHSVQLDMELKQRTAQQRAADAVERKRVHILQRSNAHLCSSRAAERHLRTQHLIRRSYCAGNRWRWRDALLNNTVILNLGYRNACCTL
jgi:hypothetical protein